MISIREKIAEQICECSNNIVIQRIYKIREMYETIHEVWTPRLSWFRPPAWKIFRWAYKIETQKVVDKCPRPLEIKHGTPTNYWSSSTIVISDDLNKKMKDWAKEHGIHLYGD